jgi:lipid II:glycine glycyltransferase (peptidoglycan interpeptide bridge formation enzyme)
MHELKLVPCAESNRWEELLRQQESATVFHRQAWLHLVAALSHSELRLYEVHQRGNVVGVCPLFFFRRGPVRIAACPPPQAAAPYLGPAVSRDLLPAALAAAASEARRQGAAYVEFRCQAHVPPSELSEPAFSFEPRSTFILDLRSGPDYLWSNRLEPACRRAVRKAQNSGVVVEEVALRDIVDDYFAMAEQVFAKSHRPPPLSREDYEQMARALEGADLAKVLVARHDGTILAAGIFPYDQRTVYYLDGVSLSEGQALRPNNLLHWEVIRWACQAGLAQYDMVGAGIAGVARFKRTFGPEEVPYTYCYRALSPWVALARRAYALLAPAGRAIRYVLSKRS